MDQPRRVRGEVAYSKAELLPFLAEKHIIRRSEQPRRRHVAVHALDSSDATCAVQLSAPNARDERAVEVFGIRQQPPFPRDGVDPEGVAQHPPNAATAQIPAIAGSVAGGGGRGYARFFIDTNRVDAIPDEHGERRYFIVKCNEAMIGHDPDYFAPLREEVLADDRVIRALYEFLCMRAIKSSYHGKDIPVGEYARALKNSKRSEAEEFLEWLVEKEDMAVQTLHLTAEAFATRYKAFKPDRCTDSTGEERSTDSIMKQLNLQSISGVAQHRARPQNLSWCPTSLNYPSAPLQCSFCTTGRPDSENKVMRQYVLDCDVLRERYKIEETVAPSAAQPAASINCEVEVERFCALAPASNGEEGPSDEELIAAAEEAEAEMAAGDVSDDSEYEWSPDEAMDAAADEAEAETAAGDVSDDSEYESVDQGGEW